jgi:hypothetical protein
MRDLIFIVRLSNVEPPKVLIEADLVSSEEARDLLDGGFVQASINTAPGIASILTSSSFGRDQFRPAMIYIQSLASRRLCHSYYI